MFLQTKKNEKFMESNVKEWFIIIGNKQLGPYSLADLKEDPRFNPDILVWKRGFREWIQARFVPEMQDIFKDEPETQALHEPEKGKGGEEGDVAQQNQATLTLQQDPYQFFLWILLLLLIIFYTFYQFYYQF